MIIGIQGPRGTGKSNLAVSFLEKDYNAGRRIVSNMKELKIPQTYMSLDDIVENFKDLRNVTILADEIHLAVDTRRSLSKRNVRMNTFFTQLRKRNIVLIYTTQYYHDLDKRLKRQTDKVYFMSKKKIPKMGENGKPIIKKVGGKTKMMTISHEHIFLYEVYDRSSEFPEPVDIGEFDGKPYWKYYDTFEIIETDVE